MRLTLLPVAAALLLAGCGHNDSSAPTAAAPSGPREIDISANDTMHYDVTAMQAKPGEDLKVVLTNAGNNPVEVMGHNWILLKAGSDAAAFAMAATQAKATNYVPDSLKDEIVAQIPLQGPHKSGEVTFKAPTTPGDYPYLCSFPAHYQVGMHGILTVK